MRLHGFRLLAFGLVLWSWLPVLSVAEPGYQKPEVHPLVWESLQAGGETEVLLVMRDQADLGAAPALLTREAKGRYVYETLRAVADKTQADLRANLQAQGVEYQSFYIVNAIKVRLDGPRLRALSARSDVARIVPNPWVKGIPDPDPISDVLPRFGPDDGPDVEPNIRWVHAEDVWDLGYSGHGVIVAGADTGYDWEHPALQAQYRGWDGASVVHDYHWHDAIHSGGGACGPDSPEPCDDHGHGTHTMGTMVGDDGGSNQIGMAPGAEWIGCRNMDVGYGTPATYIECFEFFLAPYAVGATPEQGDPARAPHVVNNSWSCPASEGCDAGTLEAAVATLRQAGIVVVVSGTNRGPACSTIADPPALYQGSFTVGALDHATGQIASLSARGPVSYNGLTYVKPDIAAPGVNVRSSVPGAGFGYASGTSMAAPHVSGAVALLLSAAPGYSGQVGTIEQMLTGSAETRLEVQCGDPEPPNNVWGWGALDALDAVRLATGGRLSGVVTDAATGTPIAGARVVAESGQDVSGGVTEVITEASGFYTMTLPAGTYAVSASADSYRVSAVADIAIGNRQDTMLDFALVPIYQRYCPLGFLLSGASD
jgi:subtilisin family serine protease